MPECFILVYRTPQDEIKVYAHGDGDPTVYAFRVNATAVSYTVLTHAGVDYTDAEIFRAKFTEQPTGTVWGHPTRYDFRVLAVDFTVDGVPITPGLRVLDYDREWGTVEETQFLAEEYGTPGGQFFDHWYYVRRDGEDRARKRFNGERLTTKEPKP